MEIEITSDTEYENIIQNTKLIFPEIEFNAEDYEFPYVAISNFNNFIIDQFAANNKELIQKAFNYIEVLHNSKSGKVREFATIGILEGIQNIRENNNFNTEEIEKYLGKVSMRWWRQLIKFWNNEIKYVGETINE